MIEALLIKQRLEAVRDALRQTRVREASVWPLLVGAVFCAVLIAWQARLGGLHPAWWVGAPLATALLLLFSRRAAARRDEPDAALARRVEVAVPGLDARLLTAVSVIEHKKREPLGYLEARVLEETLRGEDAADWEEAVLADRPARATRRLLGAQLAFLLLFLWLSFDTGRRVVLEAQEEAPALAAGEEEQAPPPPVGDLTFEVTPGDVEIERGTRLIVEAVIGPSAPAGAALVWKSAEDGAELGRSEMRPGLEEGSFGAFIPAVGADIQYFVEAGDSASAVFTASIFDLPKLERIDVTVTPPAHTGLPPREQKNIRQITVPQQSQVDFRVRVNKPLAAAELFSEEEESIELKPSQDDPLVLVASLTAMETMRYRVHLVDEKERANAKPPWVRITVKPDTPPQIELVFPKRDIQVSPLQELPLEARVWDDVSVKRSGLVVQIAGVEHEFPLEHEPTAPGQKIQLTERLLLEEHGAKPRQLVTYHFWAEDSGPGGETRRSMSDMFFATVRHFEDIFREAEPPPPGGMPGEQQGQADQLVNLQKQIVNATWRLLRDVAGGNKMEAIESDTGVVLASQETALNQTKEQMEEARDSEIRGALTEAWKSMRDAMDSLRDAREQASRPALASALDHEQAALQWLHQAAEREHLVSRQNRNQQGGGQQGERQEQLANLELTQEEQRYEQESAAAAEQSPAQRETLDVLNRLKELARRQEALARKINELREQMANASSQERQDELAEQLQRLQQEQENLLRDLDETRERIENSERASEMADAAAQLDEARQQALDAADQLAEGRADDAANSATRAQRELADLESSFRQQAASAFREQAMQIREQARAADQAQKEISEALENQRTPEGAERGDASNTIDRMFAGAATARALQEQQERVSELFEQMRELSTEAEATEPLLSRRLNDAARAAQTSGLEENLEEARMQSRYGDRASAQEAERKAALAVEKLARQVERAAEAVLGSETEALKQARSQLDELIGIAEDEERAEQARAGGAGDETGEQGTNQTPGEGREPGAQTAQSTQGGRGGQGEPAADEATERAPGSGAGETAQSAESPAEGGQPGGQPGEPGGPEMAATGTGGQEPGGSDRPGDSPSPAGEPAGEGSREGQSGQAGKQAGQPGGETAASGSPGSEPGAGGGMARNEAAGERGEGSDEPGDQPGGTPGQAGQQGARGARTAGSMMAGGGALNQSGGGDGGHGGWFFDEPGETPRQGPFTGEGYRDWSERLSMVEELLQDPDLANRAARVADDARALRLDMTRNDPPPAAAIIRQRITEPLVELRNAVLDELARKAGDDPSVPIDRDPVPPAYRELVRKYFIELGGDTPAR
jgi:hypothetical protein